MICIIQETIRLFNSKNFYFILCKFLTLNVNICLSSSAPSHSHPHQLPNTPDSNDINMICNMFFSRWWDRNFRQVSGQSGSPYQRKRLSYLPCWWLSWQSLVWERHGNLDQWETTWWNIILTDPWGCLKIELLIREHTKN